MKSLEESLFRALLPVFECAVQRADAEKSALAQAPTQPAAAAALPAVPASTLQQAA